MKGCELCKSPAVTYCVSDQASLCWHCDANVHGANFLVARHSRSLLCHTCQSITPWKASGAKLGHTVSICERCSANEPNNQAHEESDYPNDDLPDDDDEEDEAEEEQEEEMEGDGDNQVVPLSSTTPPPPPPPSTESNSSSISSSSSSSSSTSGQERLESVRNVVSLKRTCEDYSTDLRFLLQNDIKRSSSQRKYGHHARPTSQAGEIGDREATSVDYSLTPLKGRRIEPVRPVHSDFRSA